MSSSWILYSRLDQLIDKLTHHQRANDFTKGFLDMIKEDMLVTVDEGQIPRRKSARQIAMAINELYGKQDWMLPEQRTSRQSTLDLGGI